MPIHKKYTPILFSVVMAFFMALTMSFVMTLLNLGPVPFFMAAWMRSFAVGFLVALPVSLLMNPLIRKIVGRLTGN